MANALTPQFDRAATRRTFEALADVWRRDTAHLSSVTRKVSHPAYRAIVAPAAAQVQVEELDDSVPIAA